MAASNIYFPLASTVPVAPVPQCMVAAAIMMAAQRQCKPHFSFVLQMGMAVGSSR